MALYTIWRASATHQALSMQLQPQSTPIFFAKGLLPCFTAPFDVKLSDQPLTMVQPDIMIICDKDKLDQKRCNGAPDFIIEIVSPSTSSDDYIRKLYYYKTYGVREYWIVDPKRKLVTVNYFEGNLVSVQYSFDSVIKVNIYDDLFINFAEIAELSGI
ncbi:MAG: Uma2 family endonuclease [Lachnospiraceae bacterium]